MTEAKRIAGSIFVLWLFVLASYAVGASLSRSQSVPSHGSLVAVNVGVFQDAACTVNTTSIDWGVVDAGSATNRSIYVKNTGNTAVTLSLAATGWTPQGASAYLSVTWDREGAVLGAGQVVQTTFTLAVSASVTGFTDFSNILIVTGTN